MVFWTEEILEEISSNWVLPETTFYNHFKDGVPNIMHLDTLFNKIDVKLILYPILEIFKYEIREQKIDLILESDI